MHCESQTIQTESYGAVLSCSTRSPVPVMEAVQGGFNQL